MSVLKSWPFNVTLRHFLLLGFHYAPNPTGFLKLGQRIHLSNTDSIFYEERHLLLPVMYAVPMA